MSDWPKFNPERHVPWMSHLGSTALQCNGCLALCSEGSPCRCCETARADAAEAALQRVRAVPEKDRSPFSDDRARHGLDYVDGWNDALDYVEQALDGGAE